MSGGFSKLKEYVRADGLMALLALACTLGVYAFYVYGLPENGPVRSHTERQGRSFLMGNLHLDMVPSRMLEHMPDPYDPAANRNFRLHDASYYNGRYYYYFGPVPALLLWVPVKWLTGMSLTDEDLGLILASIGTVCMFGLICLVARKDLLLRGGGFSAGLLVVLLAAGLSTWVVFLLRRSYIYEVAILGAYCFSTMGILCLWLFLQGGRKYWLALASLCFGLSVGCRLTHIFSGIFLLLAFIHLMRRSPTRATFLSCVGWMGVPMAVCLLGLGAYNYMRFDSPLETGVTYQLGVYPQHDPAFRIYIPETFPLHAYKYLLKPIEWNSPSFPFVSLDGEWKPYSSFEAEPTFGVWANTPFSLFALLFMFDRRTRKSFSPATRLLAYGLALYAVLHLALISLFFFSTQRYAVDFAPWMIVLAGLYYLHLLKRLAQTRYYPWLLAAGGLFTLYGAFAVAMTGYCGLTQLC